MAGAISVTLRSPSACRSGLLSGYRGGFIDALISRITTRCIACPS